MSLYLFFFFFKWYFKKMKMALPIQKRKNIHPRKIEKQELISFTKYNSYQYTRRVAHSI